MTSEQIIIRLLRQIPEIKKSNWNLLGIRLDFQDNIFTGGLDFSTAPTIFFTVGFTIARLDFYNFSKKSNQDYLK